MAHSVGKLRQDFLEFFRERDHEVVASGPLIPENDPTLMFTNAGMVPFKDVFTGREKRPYRRATSSQKCIRISGKHNDLEAVGPSPRHQTFFEMLGNFSFGDYFREEAIVFAWDFLTKTLELDPKRLILTYFKGEEGLSPDHAARDLWKKVTGFGEDRVIGLGREDNFWSMGDTGPCGPCSELYYCVGPSIDLQRFGQEQDTRGHGWMEIWNLVFMQYERQKQGEKLVLNDLPAPSVDTGAGLERLACVVLGKNSNYEVDVLRQLVEVAANAAKKPYGGSMSADDVSMRVIADHARTTAFLIAEGTMPERTGRQYVLRRVMRRAIRHGHRLGITEPFLHLVAERVVELMGPDYPELTARREHLASVILAEETRFRQTIERGLGLLEERFMELDQAEQKQLSGADAFKLYDTYGFPLDLTRVICAERGIAVDDDGYNSALEEARARSEFKGQSQAVLQAYREASERLGEGGVVFSGYERDQDVAEVVALIVGGELVDGVSEGCEVELVGTRTPFYGEAGGQLGDHGMISGENAQLSVLDTQKPVPGLIVHRARVERGSLKVGDTVQLSVDRTRREAIRRSHSATHLLHWALRQVVGEHAQQKGSSVGPGRLRFDFTHPEPLSKEEIVGIEDLVNERILQNHPVRTEVMTMDQARERGAMMIFEEKYGDTVRLLTMAESLELCGGTHARATGDIGLFKITAEQGVAAGVRRLVATTGAASLAYLREVEENLQSAAQAAKTAPDQLEVKIQRLVEEERKLNKKLEELSRKLLTGGSSMDDWLGQAQEVAGAKVLAIRTDVNDRAQLRELAEKLRDRLGDSIVLVGAVSGGKAQLVLTVAKSLTPRYRAGDLIRPIAAIVGGAGGGRPDMAQAGGTEIQNIDKALKALAEHVRGAA